MTPGAFNLDLYRGDTYRWQFKFWNDADKTDPADLTGVTVKAEIRDKPQGTKLVVPMQTTVTAPNIVDMVLSAEDCKKLLAKGAWDLQLTYSGGDVVTVLAGNVAVMADVTDSAPVAP